ncbi:hypothetical protein KC363_g84 [Hortaea werneckii]|nr:hypothetical protein KC363_g84 [Hortaea werneckii]
MALNNKEQVADYFDHDVNYLKTLVPEDDDTAAIPIIDKSRLSLFQTLRIVAEQRAETINVCNTVYASRLRKQPRIALHSSIDPTQLPRFSYGTVPEIPASSHRPHFTHILLPSLIATFHHHLPQFFRHPYYQPKPAPPPPPSH